MSNRRKCSFKVFYWHNEDQDNKTVIHVGGRTADNKTVYCLIDNFTPFVNVELPSRGGLIWDKSKVTRFFEMLQKEMKWFDQKTQAQVNYGPIGEFKFYKRFCLHYMKEIYTVFLNFPSSESVRKLTYKLNNTRGRGDVVVPGVGTFQPGEFKVHEANIDPILKLSADKGIKLASWIQVIEAQSEEVLNTTIDARKFTTADIDMRVEWTDIKPIDPPKDVYIFPSYCSFDLECNSTNHNSKLPNPDLPENVVTQVSMVFGTLNNPNRKHTLISLGDPRQEQIEKCDELIVFDSEKKLLLGFSKLIQERDPDIFIHYNGLKFDWDYLIKRAEFNGLFDEEKSKTGKRQPSDFALLSRIEGKYADIKVMRWSSQACGEQTGRYLECHGRTNVDVLIEVERNHRLPNYRLNTVAEKFLGQQKEDVSPRELFMLWDLTHDVLPLVKNRALNMRELVHFRAEVEKIFEIRKCTGSIVKKYRKKLLSLDGEKFGEACREAMEIMGIYCIQDTILPIDLVEKLNIWTSMEAMSNVTHVPMTYLHTRGQQIKVLSQVYREAIPRKIVIPTLPRKDVIEKYQGATVIEANAGDYGNVATLDFASLYPTIMIAFNISYDTILNSDDKTPDELCHVLEFKSHVGCEHDEQKRKKKAEDVICKDYRLRFRKVQYKIDAEGNVKREFEGLMPRLERNLMAARKEKKKEMGKVEAILKMHKGKATEEELENYKKWGHHIVEKGSLNKEEESTAEINFNTLNANQLAIKIACNSAYGVMGVQNGMIPLIEGAASVTAMGRRLIMMTIERIKKEYPFAKLVYGDSVAKDTPILCRLNGKIFYRTIENLPTSPLNNNELFEKEYFVPAEGLEVWSDKGFTLVKKIIRHKTTKRMYRVLTNTGCVDVTEDHSLLDEFAEKITPNSVKVGDKLLHQDLPKLTGSVNTVLKLDSTKIPDDIFEYEERVRRVFLHHCTKNIQFSKDKLELAKLYFLANSLGYSVKFDSHNSVILTNTIIENSDKIIGITELLPIISSGDGEYVYDLETENHHFAAGVGRMVVHNTDSCMIHFTGKTLAESWDLADEASKIATHSMKCYVCYIPEDYCVTTHEGEKVPIKKFTHTNPNFKHLNYKDQCHVLDYHNCPIELEFENLYGRYLLLTKKRYFAYSVNKKGDLLGITKKGIVLTRRDNCKYLRDTYEATIKGIVDDLREQDVMYRLYDRIQMLFTRQISHEHLIIYMGVKNIINYAESKKTKKGRTVISQVPIDKFGVMIEDVVGPLDPRLVYRNLPQVLLALKMMRRGEEIPPNTRLEFLYLLTKGATHQGEKAEDYTYYKEHKEIENLKPDNLHYIEKQLTMPITELLTVKFKKEVIPYVEEEERFRRCIDALSEKHRPEVARKTVYIKSRPVKKYVPEDGELIGWDVLKAEGYTSDKRSIGKLAKDNPFTEYHFKKYLAISTFVVDEMKKPLGNSLGITKELYPDLYKLCTWYKSLELLKSINKKYGIKCRKWAKPTKFAQKLQQNVKIVMLTDDHAEQNVSTGALGTILIRYDLGTKADPIYHYDILIGENEATGTIIKNVPRKSFTTYTVRDSKVMKNILKYREHYAEVVEHLNKINAPIKFEGE